MLLLRRSAWRRHANSLLTHYRTMDSSTTTTTSTSPLLITDLNPSSLSLIAARLSSKPIRKLHPTTRQAAVLIPLCHDHGVASLLLTVRSSSLRHHTGQVAFPGGHIEEGETAVQAALRETQEEIGLTQQQIQILGEHHQARTLGDNKHTLISPVVGYITTDISSLSLTLSPAEVSAAFTVPLSTFLSSDPAIRTQYRGYVAFNHKRLTEGDVINIWGATAYIIDTLVTDILKQQSIPDNKHNRQVDTE